MSEKDSDKPKQGRGHDDQSARIQWVDGQAESQPCPAGGKGGSAESGRPWLHLGTVPSSALPLLSAEDPNQAMLQEAFSPTQQERYNWRKYSGHPASTRVVRDSTLPLSKLKPKSIPLLLSQVDPAKASKTTVRPHCLGFVAQGIIQFCLW